MIFKILLLLFTLTTQVALAQESIKIHDDEELPRYIPRVREDISTAHKAINFGAVYAAQWTYYLIGQHSIIQEHGSYHNWLHNPFSPHFDKDSFDYNLFKHSLTGNYYYLFYRSRGYTEQNAFIWSVLSSLAFEFTIETFTERPSYQDIYQTPVFGTVLGIGSEKLSRYLHGRDTWWGHGLGYLLNPFTLIPEMEEHITMTPVYNQKTLGAQLTYRF